MADTHMIGTSLRKIFSIRKVLYPHDLKSAFSRALILLIITVFLISPPIGMRFFRSDILILILITGIFYHVFFGLVALARQVSTEAPLRTIEGEEFAETLPPWIRLTLLSLNKYGWAKRRAELKLTRRRSRILAEMGLAKENEHGSLVITPFGRTVVKVLRPPQAEIAGKEDSALRTQSGRVLESLPGVLRRIASVG